MSTADILLPNTLTQGPTSGRTIALMVGHAEEEVEGLRTSNRAPRCCRWSKKKKEGQLRALGSDKSHPHHAMFAGASRSLDPLDLRQRHSHIWYNGIIPFERHVHCIYTQTPSVPSWWGCRVRSHQPCQPPVDTARTRSLLLSLCELGPYWNQSADTISWTS